ncbi:DNA-directed RNA polymerase [Coemansia sp. Benny D115]|nr:DNA-directed RNA polymerase [Coemansia sp. Benny D115]
MSQLMLRAIRPFSRTASSRSVGQISGMGTRMPILCAQTRHQPRQQGTGISHNWSDSATQIRLFSQPALKVDTDTDLQSNGNESLFAMSGSDLVSLGDMREDAGYMHYMQTGKTLTEQLSAMQACLVNGGVERAQRILVGLYKLYPEMMKQVGEVSVHNEILSSLMTSGPKPLATEALLWYDQMERTYNVKANANTFAILIRGFIRSEMQNVGMVMMQEMLRSGITFHDMLLSSYLSDSDIEAIKEAARTILTAGSDNANIAAGLLDAVNTAESELDASASSADENAMPVYTNGGSNVLATTDSNHNQLKSSGVLGILQLKNTLRSLYSNELEGYNLQMRLERDTYESEIARLREINKKRNDPLLMTNIGGLKKLTATWLPQLEALIEEEQGRCMRAVSETETDRGRAQYGQFFTQLQPSKVAIITILETLRHNATSRKSNKVEVEKFIGVKTVTLVTAISQAVHNEIRFEQMKARTNRHILSRNMSVAKLASSGKLFNMTLRRVKAKELQSNNTHTWLDSWDVVTKTRIGSLLLSMLIEVARIPDVHIDPDTGEKTERMAPAFYHDYHIQQGRKYGIVRAHEQLLEMFKGDSIVSGINARQLPMLVPPRPWLTYDSGGYLSQDEPCMRMKGDSEQIRYLKHASDEGKLFTLLMGLDSLGATRWAINPKVFDVVRKVWNSGKAFAEIPASNYDEPEPVKPAEDADQKTKLKYAYELRAWKNEMANQHSQRCDCNYKVEIAQAFLNHPMYFPHNMDFRGRAYPIPPHFNHLGNDLCRGLLLFDEGKPLTERGLWWLKIHLANLYGKDKLSHADRIKFVEDNHDRILASADNPVSDELLGGSADGQQPFWAEAGSPWQTLSACIEYAAAMRSPNPAEYVCRLHIHQDGTCNGLQHYAAMGRDRKGAFEVNLLPSDRPQDVYQGILNVVDRLIDEDALNGVPQAVALKGKLTRKIVKQTVMTNVYGVTLIGAREQIAARLREVKNESGGNEFELTDVNGLALYVAKKIFDSLGEMFTQAQEIQNWLNESARRIAKSMPNSALSAWKKMVLESKDAQAKLRAAISDAQKNKQELKSSAVFEMRPDLGPGSTRHKRLNELATKPMSTVVWTTPLGLTVVQPYRRYALRNVSTPLQSISVLDTNMPSPVNSQKQKTAFPPNFVHSLDASHMVLSAIECSTAGLTFASVHDSYWTHACDIDQMNEILRDQFVKLHKRPIMEMLKEEFETRYADHKMPVIRWEYVQKLAHSTSTGSSGKMSKVHKKRAEEQLVESALAMKHLEVCNDGEEIGPDAQAHTGTEESGSTVHPIEAIDLANLELINPEKDLLGALQQADRIKHTILNNRIKLSEELNALTNEHTRKARQARAKAKSQENKLKKKKTGTQKTKVIKEAVVSADATVAKEKTATEAEVSAMHELSSLFASAESMSEVKEKLSKYLFDLKSEYSKAKADVKAKYITDFDMPTIIISEQSSPEMFAQVTQMIKEKRLTGSLTQRTLWVDIEFDPLPAHGDFELETVLESPYFFS